MTTRDVPREAPVPPLDPGRVRTIEEAGGQLAPLSPVGASLAGIDLGGDRPGDAVLAALEADPGWPVARRSRVFLAHFSWDEGRGWPKAAHGLIYLFPPNPPAVDKDRVFRSLSVSARTFFVG